MCCAVTGCEAGKVVSRNSAACIGLQSAVRVPGRASGAEGQGARASGAHDPYQPLNGWRRCLWTAAQEALEPGCGTLFLRQAGATSV